MTDEETTENIDGLDEVAERIAGRSLLSQQTFEKGRAVADLPD